MSKQLTVARAASERTVGEWQARSESKEAAVLTAKTNEIAGACRSSTPGAASLLRALVRMLRKHVLRTKLFQMISIWCRL